MPPSRATATPKATTNHHHRRFHSLHRLEADSDADDDAAHSYPQLDRRAASFGGGERRILAAIRSEESAMMTNVHLAHGAIELVSQT